ncbi:site-specific DNA-methyltransferase [Mycoplasma sp. 1018B]|uniref:DNA-methyltransferase n=1 Tax=Mycoplasma sp. 1018B TaxID=2967302 RepID=UPI00211BC9BA|nr:site-specific DNA-methyltransferase [Mycoplasma sp. 1018B]UUM19319.1 DNA methyltransferase [Mycoplasma sp. 1018B]
MIDVNKIINDDSIKVLKKLPSESIDLIFVDPPYWMRTKGKLLRVDGTEFNGVKEEWDKFATSQDYNNFTREWLKECYRILKKNGSIWVIGGMQCIYTIGGIMQDLGYWILNDVIWQKTNPTPNFKGTRLTNSHETLIWATKSSNSKYTFNYKTAKELNTFIENFNKGNRKQLGSIWKFPVVNGKERLKDENNKKLHSTQKPELLLYYIINISSKIGDIILDPFAGTMTTAKIAKQTGRNYLMIEKDPKYCYFGQKRIDQTEIKIDKIENAFWDQKAPKVVFKDLINNNYLTPGEIFYLKNQEESKFILTEDAKLKIDNQILDIHKAAALANNSKSERLNGFNYWFVKRNNQKVALKEIREIYRKNKKE